MARKDFLQKNLEHLRRAFLASGLSPYALAQRSGGRVSYQWIYRHLAREDDATPEWQKLVASAAALGVDLLSEPEVEVFPVGQAFALPVVAEGEALYAKRKPDDGRADAEEGDLATIDFAGLVLALVRDESMLNVIAPGQHAILDPALHPDDAKPHPCFTEPLAFVRLRDGRHIFARWRHDKEAKTVTLLTVNHGVINPDTGLPPFEVVHDTDIAEAWTVVGSRW